MKPMADLQACKAAKEAFKEISNPYLRCSTAGKGDMKLFVGCAQI